MRRLALVVIAALMVPARAQAQGPAGPGDPPRVPPFAGSLVNWDRAGEFTAICTTDDAGKTATAGTRAVRPTYVYVIEREIIRQLGSSPGACDPAFAPDGSLLAVVTTNGVWLYSPRLDDPRQLAAPRQAPPPATGSDSTTFSQPKWSSDGLRIAYVVGSGATAWVEVVDVTTTRLLHRSREETSNFAWTSDPRVITVGTTTVRLP